MPLIKWSPFLLDSWEELEKAMRDFHVSNDKIFVPSMNIFHDKGNVVVEANIPELDPKNIDITIEENVLTLRGQTEKKTEVEEKNYYRKEIKSGSFQRSVMLPVEVFADKAKASYEEGKLRITIPSKHVALKKEKATKVPIIKKK